MSQFLDWFESDGDCAAYLRLRWPHGFSCPSCGPTDAWLTRRHLYVCTSCGRQTSVAAGTVFEKTRRPLLTWFRAIWMLGVCSGDDPERSRSREHLDLTGCLAPSC